MKTLLLLIANLSFLFAAAQKKQADLIVHHAMVYTVDSVFTKAEAFAVKDGKLAAVGSNTYILLHYTSTHTYNAGGKAIYPGFIDAHAHFVGYAQSLFSVDLFDVKSEAELVKRVQAFAASHPDTKWILGRGWDQNKFPGKAFPNNKQLTGTAFFSARLLISIRWHSCL